MNERVLLILMNVSISVENTFVYPCPINIKCYRAEVARFFADNL